MKTMRSIIRSFLSPLSLGEGQGVRPLLLLVLAFLASCGEQTDLDRPVVTDGETVEVTKEIQVNVLPMQSMGTTTRAGGEQPEKGESIRMSFGSDVVTRVNEGTTDMSADESKINNAYILQFEGTASTSVLKKKQSITSAQLTGGSAITCSFSMTAGVKNRVYVVANVPASVTLTENTTTLADFEKAVSYTVSSSLPSTGLPMSSMQDVGVGDTFDVFQLRSVLAKLTFKTGAGTLKLKGVPDGYSFYTQAQPGENAVRPSGTTYNTAGVALTSGATYYVPQNLSGRNDLLIYHYTRALGMAPANSAYVEITNSGTTYSLLLGDGSAQDFNFVGGYAYNINATIYGTDTYDLRVNSPATVTDLNADGQTANCYIVTANNGLYMFNSTVMGNGATSFLPAGCQGEASVIIPSKLTPQSADVLWETLNTTTAPAKGDIVNNIYVLKDRFLFRSGSKQGNAVIAARDASNRTIWSWHIWKIASQPTAVTLADITDGSGFTVSGLKLMDRNLGALNATAQDNGSIGLLYQWGRKDPFPGGADLSAVNTSMATTLYASVIDDKYPDTSSSKVSVEDAIEHPTTFYNTGGDWCSTRNDNLWGTPLKTTVTISNNKFNSNPGTKSIYDPCPVGWRTAPTYVFANASTSNGGSFNKGYSFTIGKGSAPIWFPATGYLDYDGGTLVDVGTYGEYWSSTPSATNPDNVGTLSFIEDYVDPGSSRRALGSSTRCTME